MCQAISTVPSSIDNWGIDNFDTQRVWQRPALLIVMPSRESPPTVKHLKIAFTYDSCSDWIARGYSPGQCAEFQDDETIEGIAASLRKLGTVEMVGGVKSLAKRLASSQPDWDLVFNFCEGYGTLGREAQVPALLEAWDIPFTFSDSATLALCMDKAKTKVSKLRSAR